MLILYFRGFLVYFPKCPFFSIIQSYVPNATPLVSSLNFNSISLAKIKFLFFNAPLITPIHLAWYVIMLSKELHIPHYSAVWFVIICTGDGWLQILIILVLSRLFPFQSTSQFQLLYQLCSIASFFPKPVAWGHLRILQYELLLLLKFDTRSEHEYQQRRKQGNIKKIQKSFYFKLIEGNLKITYAKMSVIGKNFFENLRTPCVADSCVYQFLLSCLG